MKKKSILIVIVIIAFILLFPIPMKLKDGGTTEYKALLYQITDYHKLAPMDSEIKYIEGIKIEILGMEIFNNVKQDIKQEKPHEIADNEYGSFVGTVLEETTTYMIVEPNEDEIERKSSDKIKINYGTDHYDYLYGIGRKVIIKYTGYIMESYPAQINTDEILIDGYEDFEISVKKSDNIAKTKILNNKELYKNNSDFNLYYYGLDKVNIFVDNKNMSLEEALRTGKMTINGILKKANKDVSDGIVKSETYKEGGSTEWYYDEYTIIKYHSLDGNRDVIIGIPEMRLNNLK